MTRQEMKELAKNQIRGKLGGLFAVYLVVAILSSAVSFIPIVGSIASLFVTPALNLSLVMVYLRLAKEPEFKPDFGDALQGFNNILNAFKVYLASGIITFLWSLLFIIPGIIKNIAYSQAYFILAENPEIETMDALKRSEQMMDGHKMDYFVLNLSFFGWSILATFTCGLLFIWLLPYMNMTYTNFYNSIKPVENVMYTNYTDAQFN